mgnify:CR=1 FL=1
MWETKLKTSTGREAFIIKNAIIELPSLSEQKYLASLMREVESKIVNEKNMLSKLEVQKAYLLSHLFI